MFRFQHVLVQQLKSLVFSSSSWSFSLSHSCFYIRCNFKQYDISSNSTFSLIQSFYKEIIVAVQFRIVTPQYETETKSKLIKSESTKTSTGTKFGGSLVLSNLGLNLFFPFFKKKGRKHSKHFNR